MYLELNNLFVFENQNPVNTNIENEIKKLNNTGISEFYTSFLKNVYVKISIKRDITNQYSITCLKYNNTTGQYNDFIFDGEITIDNNRLLISRLITLDRNTDIFYYKRQNDVKFIKLVYCKNDHSTPFKYILEQSNDTTCRDEFERLCKQQYYDELNCVSIIKVNEIGKPQIEKKENTAINSINNILKQQVQKSDGFNYGLHNQLNYSRVVLECQHIDNIRLFQELGKEYFSKPMMNLKDFLSDFGLELLQNNEPQNDKPKPNFAIIPVSANGHISTLLFDLRPNIPEQIPKRLYSFDSSLYHYKQNIFGNLISEDHKLSAQSLQLTGCCGYWTSCFIEECSEIEDIEEVKQQFQTGEMQLKIACKVSEIINATTTKLIYKLKDPLYNEWDDDSKSFIEDNILIKIKDTNKYFLLDGKNIYKSTCIDLEAIYNLIQQKGSQLITSDNDLVKLKEQIIKQNQELFNIKQKKIEEIKKQIEPIKEILKMELEMYKLNKLHHEKLAMLNSSQSVEASKTLINTLNELFCSNLAKLEYLRDRIKLNLGRQWEYLTNQNNFCKKPCFLRDYLELPYKCVKHVKQFKKAIITEQNETLANQTEILRNNNMYYGELNENCTQLLEQIPQDKQQYLIEQREHYHQLFTIEQRDIKNTQNDYYQMPNLNQLQLDELNRCILEIEKSSIKNSKTTQLTKR